MTTLDVYISENCWSCEEAIRIVHAVGPLFPGIEILLRDLQSCEAPQEVFAVPTYVLDGKVIYLGNPTREQLIQKLEETQKRVLVN